MVGIDYITFILQIAERTLEFEEGITMKFVKRILFWGVICCLGILNCYVSHAQEKYEGMCGEDVRWTCSD